jgi:hypothetical protein
VAGNEKEETVLKENRDRREARRQPEPQSATALL